VSSGPRSGPAVPHESDLTVKLPFWCYAEASQLELESGDSAQIIVYKKV